MLPGAGGGAARIDLLEVADADGATAFSQQLAGARGTTQDYEGVEVTIGARGISSAQTDGFLVIGSGDGGARGDRHRDRGGGLGAARRRRSRRRRARPASGPAVRGRLAVAGRRHAADRRRRRAAVDRHTAARSGGDHRRRGLAERIGRRDRARRAQRPRPGPRGVLAGLLRRLSRLRADAAREAEPGHARLSRLRRPAEHGGGAARAGDHRGARDRGGLRGPRQAAQQGRRAWTWRRRSRARSATRRRWRSRPRRRPTPRPRERRSPRSRRCPTRCSSRPESTRPRPARRWPRSRPRWPPRSAPGTRATRRRSASSRSGASRRGACRSRRRSSSPTRSSTGSPLSRPTRPGSRTSPATAASTRTRPYERATEGFGDELSLLAFFDLAGLVEVGEQRGLAEDPAYATFAGDFRSLDALGLEISSSDDVLATDARLLLREGSAVPQTTTTPAPAD